MFHEMIAQECTFRQSSNLEQFCQEYNQKYLGAEENGYGPLTLALPLKL
jgi:hypothetical protein